MAKLFVRKCPCLRPKIEEDVKVLDYRHCSLNDVPGEVFNYERTLEELLVDSNQIKDLPRELFYCHGIRKLSLSDNEIKQIPGAIGHLISLENLDLSKNGVIDIPESIKTCKYLQIVDASVNPLGKLPDGFTQLLNLTQLYLNDTFLDYLPGNFGRLSKLKILEIRENHLKTLPKSFSRLVDLEKLDLGQNEFSELPDVVGSLSSLLELWCDNNQIQSITPTIGNLKQLMFFDGCKNCLQTIPSEIEGCTSLADLHLTTNQLQALPDSIGELGNLTTLKVDDNCLTSLPHNLGGLSSLSEINVSANNLQDLPSSLGLLRYLRTLYADENELTFIPAELGSCSGITVLSLRSNKLSYIPDEIGRIPRLRVLNLSANQLRCLPFTIVKLKELQALWLSENQTRPLIPLQSEHEPDTGRKILTCYLLPQRQLQDSGDHGGDTDSFHASMWEEERRTRQQIHFEFGDESDVDGSLIRQPTPYPKEMREKARHLKNLALRQQMSNGAVVRQGEDNPAYEERRYKSTSPSMEHLTLINQDGEGLEPRMRDSRGHKPGSPSIHDPYTLFKYDKEKLARDKARMQQRHSQSYEHEDDRQSSPRKHRSRENSPAASDRGSRRGKDRNSRTRFEDDDDGGFQAPRVSSLGSTPDIPSATSDRVSSSAKFTYCSPEELSQNVSARSDSHRSHGNHPRSHRHRRMRDYDSDTGYRSDQELMKFRRQQQQMFQRTNDNYSEIVPVARSKGRRRDGYSSDLEGYSQRSMGAAYREINSAENGAVNLEPRTCSVGFDLSQSKTSLSQYSQSGAVRNDELYEHSLTESSKNHYPSSSPSPLQRRNVVDQSTPLTPTAPRSSLKKKDTSDIDFKKDLFNVQDSHQTDRVIDPENRYMPSPPQGNVSLQEDGRPIPPYKPAPPYASSPAQRKLPPTPNRSSPYGVSMYDRQARNSPMKDYQQRMPDIKESRDSNSDLSINRSRSQLHRNSDLELQGYRSGDNNQSNYMEIPNGPGESPRTSTSDSANVSRSFIGHHQGDVTSASSKDSGNYSYHDRTVGESPVNFRNSPSAGLQDRQGSRNSPSDYMQCHDPRRNFDRYDHSYREPTTVHIPTRYDEIAMFKSAEPPSQVSSSTDSGYGHNLFDKMLEAHRFSGNKGSPSPDQFNSDSNCTSTSSHPEVLNGQYSRGTTPVNHQDVSSREGSEPGSRFDRLHVTITKNPGLGFSIAGGKGVHGNPFRPNDLGIFVTKVQQNGPASSCLRPGDKLLEVNGIDFSNIEHTKAVNVLKSTNNSVELCVERINPS